MIALWFLPNSCRPRECRAQPNPAARAATVASSNKECSPRPEGSLVSPAGGSEVVGSATAAHDGEGVCVGVGEPIVVSDAQVSG